MQICTCVCVCVRACCFIRLRCLYSKSLERAGSTRKRRGIWRPRKRASISDKANRPLFSTVFTTGMDFTQLPTQQEQTSLKHEVRQPVCQVNHLPHILPGLQTWDYISSSTYFKAWCFITYRDNITFTPINRKKGSKVWKSLLTYWWTNNAYNPAHASRVFTPVQYSTLARSLICNLTLKIWSFIKSFADTKSLKYS